MRTPTQHQTASGEVYWRVRYRRGGKQRALTFYGKRAEQDAREFAGLLDTIGADRAVAYWNSHLEATAPALTLDDWFPRHLKMLPNASDGTKVSYERIYARFWAEPLGRMPLDQITAEHIGNVVNDLADAGKSDKTVKNAYGVIATAFKNATRAGILPDTPCRNVKLPRRSDHERQEMRFLDHAEWMRLYAALPEHYRPLFMFLIGTGARWGEAEALEVRDIVLVPQPVVRITKAAKWDVSKASRTIGPTKTRESRRTVTLPAEVVESLAPLLARPGTDRLFTAPRGGPLRHRTVYDEWKRAVERAGLEPQPRIHDLTHTHVAWLIAAGIPLPAIKQRLGHKEITTTIDTYGHLMPDLQLQAARAAQAVMSGLSLRELEA